MDGVSLNRISPVRSLTGPVGVSNATEVAGGAAYAPDALGLNGQAPAGGAAELSRASNVLNVLEAATAAANTAQAAGDPNRAQQLFNYADVLRFASDPGLAATLAQAFSNPTASPQAARLNAALLGNQPLAGGYLVALLSFQTGDRAELAAKYPNNIFTNGQANGPVLATQLLQEIANPAQAYQGNRETCGATVAQGMLAESNPTKYIEAATALAIYGQAYLPSGKVINRDPNWNFQGDGNRPLTGKLLQPALMADAGGSYDNAQDTVQDHRGAGKGLTTDEMQKLIQDVTSSATTVVQTQTWNASTSSWSSAGQPDQLGRMQQALAAGSSVPVLLSIQANQSFGHYERVKAIAGNQVTCLNPWGHEEVMSLDQFRARLISAFYS